MWIAIALAAAALEALRDLLGKYLTTRRLPEILVAWSLLAFGALVLLPPLLVRPLPAIGRDFWWVLPVDAAITVAGNVLYVRALRLGDVSATVPLMSFSPLFFLPMSPLVLNEVPGTGELGGVVLICLGAYCLNLDRQRKGLWEPLRVLWHDEAARSILWVAIAWASTVGIDKIGSENSSPLFFSTALYATSALLMLPLVVWQVRNWRSHLQPHFPQLLLLGAFKGGAMWAYTASVVLTDAANAYALKQTSSLLSVLFGGWLFRERGIRKRLLGAVLMALGASAIVR